MPPERNAPSGTSAIMRSRTDSSSRSLSSSSSSVASGRAERTLRSPRAAGRFVTFSVACAISHASMDAAIGRLNVAAAGRGIGAAIARAFAEVGADVVIATHGRGFWILDDITPLRRIAARGEPARRLTREERNQIVHALVQTGQLFFAERFPVADMAVVAS